MLSVLVKKLPKNQDRIMQAIYLNNILNRLGLERRVKISHATEYLLQMNLWSLIRMLLFSLLADIL